MHVLIVVQEVDGWCEENTYEKLRKAITGAMKRLAATVKGKPYLVATQRKGRKVIIPYSYVKIFA